MRISASRAMHSDRNPEAEVVEPGRSTATQSAEEGVLSYPPPSSRQLVPGWFGVTQSRIRRTISCLILIETIATPTAKALHRTGGDFVVLHRRVRQAAGIRTPLPVVMPAWTTLVAGRVI